VPRTYVIHICGERVLVREFVDGKNVGESAEEGKRFSAEHVEMVAVVPGRDCVMVVLEGVNGGHRFEGGE